LHTAQLMPLPLTVSCFSKIQIVFTFLVPAHPGSPGKRAVKRVCVCVCMCVCVCVCVCVGMIDHHSSRGRVHSEAERTHALLEEGVVEKQLNGAEQDYMDDDVSYVMSRRTSSSNSLENRVTCCVYSHYVTSVLIIYQLVCVADLPDRHSLHSARTNRLLVKR